MVRHFIGSAESRCLKVLCNPLSVAEHQFQVLLFDLPRATFYSVRESFAKCLSLTARAAQMNAQLDFMRKIL
jgi:hypothetical protein